MKNELPNGVIFQSLMWCPITEMIEQMQRSAYSHCGIHCDGKVIHSGSKVEILPLADFLSMGRYGQACAVYTTGRDVELFQAAKKYLGRPYDTSYNNDDPNSSYCSKLVWLAMRDLGLPAPTPAATGSLAHRHVRAAMYGYYGGEIPNDRPIVFPAHLLPYMKCVFSNYPALPFSGMTKRPFLNVCVRQQ